MRKTTRWFVIIIVACSAILIGYLYLSPESSRNAFSAVPDDAIYIIETTHLTDGWNTLSSSQVWKHLMASPYFEELNKSALSLDSLIKDSRAIDALMSDRRLLISAHMISGNEYDFIFIIDLMKASKIGFLEDYILQLTKMFNYEVEKNNFEGEEVTELIDKTTGEKLYIALINNLLACTYNNNLLKKAILQKDSNYWTNNKKFNEVALTLSSRNLFNIYFNYKQLPDFIKCYTPGGNELVTSLSGTMAYTTMNLNLDNERLSLTGYTNLDDSLSSYLHALLNVRPGKAQAYKIISDQAAIFLSVGFRSYDEFYENLEKEFSTQQEGDYEDFKTNVNRIEKLLDINIHDDFFSWIGNEIALVKLKPSPNAREEDMVVALHTSSIEKTMEGLENINKQVRKKTPLRFETTEYLNFPIHYLEIKGFFKLFFGKLFGKLEKPYYTFIEDYVVFSNSPSALMDIIDDYLKGKTLERNKDFLNFRDEFDNKANVTLFVQTPKVYSHLYFHSKPDKRPEVRKNKELIVAFSRIGFQMVSDGEMFQTTLIADHDPNALATAELEDLENAAEDLFSLVFETLSFKEKLTDEQLNMGGYFELKYENSNPKVQGTIANKAMEGIWRSYYESGNIKSVVNYENGKVEGDAVFYYDREQQPLKAEASFENDVMVGTYKEYYQNGKPKALINYKDGKAHGDAEFYYESGNLKISGSYKKGQKTGKWLHYTETGELIEKKKGESDKVTE